MPEKVNIKWNYYLKPIRLLCNQNYETGIKTAKTN